MTDTKKYVMQDVEVKLTGRKATKPGIGGKVSELVEVTPVDEDHGTWKKWVSIKTLYLIGDDTP